MHYYIRASLTCSQHNCIIRHILCHSTEGERVEITESNANGCGVKIKNVGPEDAGTWTFKTIYTDKSGYQVHPYEHKVKVTVQGTNEYLYK